MSPLEINTLFFSFIIPTGIVLLGSFFGSYFPMAANMWVYKKGVFLNKIVIGKRFESGYLLGVTTTDKTMRRVSVIVTVLVAICAIVVLFLYISNNRHLVGKDLFMSYPKIWLFIGIYMSVSLIEMTNFFLSKKRTI